jgi:hypothetical protein
MAINKIAIVGAGIFGCSIALELEKEGYEVVLFEIENDIMLKASKNNHNRIHYGYHYPRSLETTRQSLDGLLSFVANYSEAILYGFKNYYSIAKENSLTNPSQFEHFCKEAGIGFKNEYPSNEIMNPNKIAESYLVEEPIYDWTKLQDIVKKKLDNSKVQVKYSTDFTNSEESFDFVINCTYSNLNEINKFMNVEEQKFHMQDVIIPIFKSDIDKIGLTVMDGPFCSIMPKGFEKNTFLLYHAKYSILEEVASDVLKNNSDIVSCQEILIKDATEYFPFLSKSKFDGFWRTNRAIPITNNDQRLSEIITYKDNPNYITIFSGKITTAVKIAKQITIGIKTGYFNTKIYG